MKHEAAFSRFLKIVEQRKQRNDFDIRLYIENLRSKKNVFGYVDKNFRGAYGANLSEYFSESVGFDRLSEVDSGCAFIPRAPFEDAGKDSHVGTAAILDSSCADDDILFFEQGFLASAASWAHSFETKDRRFSCLSYVFDDLAFYYMSDYESRLTRKLNSDEELTADDVARAKKNIKSILDNKISKYNSQELCFNAKGAAGKKRVLVVDQSYGDASTVYGRAPERVYEDMLLAAIQENPDAEILVKTHPDSLYRSDTRAGFYSGLRDFKNVTFITDPVNPFSILETVDVVYVGTSGVGFEALLAGCKVICFGAPFYAGWGVTEDRGYVPHRRRNRSVLDIFYYFYIWYTHYHTPEKIQGCQIEDVIDFILRNRPISSDKKITESPKISVIIPTHNVELYIEQCLKSVLCQSLADLEVIVIDDASSDKTCELIRGVAVGDDRVTLLALENNVGQGFARNKGIELAKGAYVWFLDSDDYLASADVLQMLYDVAVSESSDMVRGRKACERVERIDGTFIQNRPDPSEKYYEDKFKTGRFEDIPQLLHNRHFWTFLYRREFLQQGDIKFKTTQWEERFFLTKAYLGASVISDANKDSVVYRVRAGSTARREKSILDVDRFLDNFQGVMSCYREYLSRSDAYRYGLVFNVTQYLQYIFYGFVWPVTQSVRDETVKAGILKRVHVAFQSSGVSSRELIGDPEVISSGRFKGYVYHLLLEAAKAELWSLVDKVLSKEKISVAEIYQLMLQEGPASDLTYALNNFLKYSNERVQYPSTSSLGVKRKAARPKILIHIGASKTGSTYLQHILEKNRISLIENGVYIPEFGLFWQEDRPHKQAGHAPFLHAANRKDPSLKLQVEAVIEALDRTIDTVVISSEAFFLADEPEKLVSYFSGYDVQLVAYLRRQDQWANSQYCEFVAGGAVGKVGVDFESWLNEEKTRYRMAYDRVLERWCKELPVEKFTVRIFEKDKLVNGDLLDDFLSVLNVDSKAIIEKGGQKDRNEFQVPKPCVELFRQFNQLPFESGRSYLRFVQKVHDRLKDADVSPARGSFLDRDLQRRILDQAEESNERVRRKYFADQKEPLFNTGGIVEGGGGRPDPNTVGLDVVKIFTEEYLSESGDFRVIESTSGHGAKVLRRMKPALKKRKFPAESLINFGFFAWRLPFFKMALPAIRNRLTEAEFREFEKDPANFLQPLKRKDYRFLRFFILSYSSVYGTGGWRKKLVPIVTKFIHKLKGPEVANEFIRSPVAFCRKLRNPLFAVVGRVLFPAGEVGWSGQGVESSNS